MDGVMTSSVLTRARAHMYAVLRQTRLEGGRACRNVDGGGAHETTQAHALSDVEVDLVSLNGETRETLLIPGARNGGGGTTLTDAPI